MNSPKELARGHEDAEVGSSRKELFKKRERRRAMEGSQEDSVFRRKGAAPPLDPPFLRTCTATVNRFHFKAESHTSLRLRRQQMHRFRIVERPQCTGSG